VLPAGYPDRPPVQRIVIGKVPGALDLKAESRAMKLVPWNLPAVAIAEIAEAIRCLPERRTVTIRGGSAAPPRAS